MDFSVLENIVSKRRLPPTSEGKKRRRRVAPTQLPPPQPQPQPQPHSTIFEGSTDTMSSFPQETGAEATPSSPSTVVNYYYQKENNLETNSYLQCLETPSAPPAYDTSIGYFESTIIVKQKFFLSDTLYILVGLDMDTLDCNAVMYIVDKKWWMQIELFPDCLNTIMYFRKKIDDFFATPRLTTDFQPLHTEHMRILPSKNSVPTIRLQRYRLQLAQSLDWEDPEVDAALSLIEAKAAPEITMQKHEWEKLCLLTECINEYFQLCSSCSNAADRLLYLYVKDFKNMFRQIAITANSEQPAEQLRVKEEIKKQLPIQVRNHHYSKLIMDYNPTYSNCSIISSFGVWLDAELRAICHEHVASKVLYELSKEFKWLKN